MSRKCLTHRSYSFRVRKTHILAMRLGDHRHVPRRLDGVEVLSDALGLPPMTKPRPVSGWTTPHSYLPKGFPIVLCTGDNALSRPVPPVPCTATPIYGISSRIV
jgi:hypothetical protein